MEDSEEEQFAKQGGEALELGDDLSDEDDEQELEDDDEEEVQNMQA